MDPEIDSVMIDPATGVTTSTTLSCVVSATDTEDGFPMLSFEWTNITTSAVLGTGSTVTLTSTDSSPGDVIRCDVVATDSNGGTDRRRTRWVRRRTRPGQLTDASSNGVADDRHRGPQLTELRTQTEEHDRLR